MVNATEQTLAKAKSGFKITNSVTAWDSTKTSAEITMVSSVPKTGGLSAHPSTVT